MFQNSNKLVCNISNTVYPVISEVISELSWQTSVDDSDDWDVTWLDNQVQPERLSHMKHYQRINHFPGMYLISRKNYLALNLKKLKKLFPSDFSFFPQTWIFPMNLPELKYRSSEDFYIVKPEASSQGRGIFLTKHPEDLNKNNRFVIQEYISNPFLLDGFKFDLRVYVLVTSCDPLRIFVYEDGLARLASEEYSKPSRKNLDQVYIHLTNYAINKSNKNFVNNKDLDQDHVGHKRSLKSTFQYMKEKGIHVERIIEEIDDIIIKTLCTIQPFLSHQYLACQPDDLTKAMCFEILGFDILLDENLKPYVLEVNSSPSFNTDSPLDKHLKKNLIFDSLKLAWVSRKQKTDYLKKSKNDLNKRVILGKYERISKEDREKIIKNFQVLRDKHEEKNKGKFRKIFPLFNSEKYEIFMKSAKDEWNETTGARRSLSNNRSACEKIRVSKNFIHPKRNISFNFTETNEKNVFCRLAQPMVRKVKIDIQRVIPGVVYEDKSLYKYELPKQITLNNGKISDFKQIKSLSSFEFFRRAQREFNKNSLMLKTKNN
jgi:tubulin polyglutamylase TTLL6/13